MKRYFEFQDSKSYKFWQIELDGTSFTVTYGKIGTTGLSKTQACADEAEAAKEATKLINEKLRKGYVEKTVASAKKVTRRLALSYDEAEGGKTLADKMADWLGQPQATEAEALVIGAWEDPYEKSPQAALDLLADHGAQLPRLRELFVGDIDAEECEISWIIQANYTRLWHALPQLERLHIKGSSQLALSDTPIAHANLRALIIECGGLPSTVLQRVAEAHLPKLEYLLLYLGVDDYGFDGSLDDLQPLLAADRFPRLTYLGLVDSALQDELAQLLAEAPVLDQLHTLDLSLGTLTDAGGAALLASSKVAKLKKLDLHYHYLSPEMAKRLKALPLTVDVGDPQTAEDDWRYPAVTE